MNGATAAGGEKPRISEVPGKQNTQCEHLWMEVCDEVVGRPPEGVSKV